MRRVLFAVPLSLACYFAGGARPIHEEALNAPAEPPKQAVAEPPQQTLAEVPQQMQVETATEQVPTTLLEWNAQQAAVRRAEAATLRRAVIQERAVATSQRRKQRLAATEHLPMARPTVGGSAGVPRANVYWDSPGYRPRDVDVIFMQD